MHAVMKGRHSAHAPQIGEVGDEALDEPPRSPCGPDDVPLEVDDLAAHFLLEATQAAPSTVPPAPEPSSLGSEPLEVCLGEACFEEQDGRSGQRLFERLWREIIERELATMRL